MLNTPKIYEQAVKLAYLANDQYDLQKIAEEKYRALGIASEVPGVVLPQSSKDIVMEEIRLSNRDYLSYSLAVGALIGPGVFERTELENIDPKRSFKEMSPEQKEKATKLRTQIAQQFEQYGVTEDSLQIIQEQTESGEPVFKLIHTGAGIDIGDPTKDFDPVRSYDAVMSAQNGKLFIINIDGRYYDTRQGMTNTTYEARLKYLQENNLPIPDSEQFRKDTGDVWTWTMLTGEPKTAGDDVPVLSVKDGRVYRTAFIPDNDYRDVRVCPAVVIE